MSTLVFQLVAPLAAWGEVAVGEYRPSADYPSQSAVFGLLCAALGIYRDDEATLQALQQGYRLAIGVLSTGRLLRDYHTSQVPGRSSLKKRPHATRRDELLLPKDDLNTILSSRDYRQDAAALVAVQPLEQAPYALEQLAEALQRPKLVLYLGRKSCPPAEPLFPQVMAIGQVRAAFEQYLHSTAQSWEQHAPRATRPTAQQLVRLAWGDEFADLTQVGVERPHFSVTRKDRMLSRRGWQFGDRREHVAILSQEG